MTRREWATVALAGAVAIAGVGTLLARTGQQATERSLRPARPAPGRVVPGRARLPRPVLVVSLPASRAIAFIDPRRLRLAGVLPLERSAVRGPDGTHTAGRRMLVVGTQSPAGIAWIDVATGDLLGSSTISSGLSASQVIVGSDGNVYVAADEGPVERGVLVQLDATTLSEKRRIEIGVGTGGLTLDRGGRIWTVGSQGYGRLAHSVSIVDLDTMAARIRPLPGGPSDIARAPDGEMFATLYFRNQVVRLGPNGAVTDRLRGISFHPWGIAIGDDGIGVVTTEGSADTASRAYVVDFHSLEVLSETRIQPPCRAAREVVIWRSRAFVTCIGPPRIAAIGLRSGDVVGAVDLGGVVEPLNRPFEQPRGPSIVT